MLNRTAQTDKVNLDIRCNQLKASDWKLYDLIWELDWWCDWFNIAFFRNEPVPTPVITFENARVNTLGHYRIGRNDWGVREQINLNKKHLNRPLWDILATLVHEMVHSWEYSYLPEEERTCNWYHKKLFRAKLLEIGIETNEKGQHMRVGGEFVYQLKRHGIRFDVSFKEFWDGFTGIELDPEKKKKGSSKLKKWSCSCNPPVNVRVAIADFQATCKKCGSDFVLCD